MKKKKNSKGSFYNFITKDIKEFNKITLSLFCIIFLVIVGFISYKITDSYALFGDLLEGEKTIEVEIAIDKSISEVLISKSGTGGLEEIIHEADSITEYRYRGSNPDNYVTFNDETWRIIGVFPTDDGTGKIENRVKIIRNESIGNMYWNENGVNNWSASTLNTYLNNDYYNTLTSSYSTMIGDATYYLGGYNDMITIPSSEEMYDYERNGDSYIAKVAIMYASDYGYGSDSCDFCSTNNWLFLGTSEWLMTPNTESSYNAMYVTEEGGIDIYSYVDGKQYAVRPVLYLTSDVIVTGGDGTSTSPYIISK